MATTGSTARVELAGLADPKTRIVAALYNVPGQPMRQAEIVSATELSSQLVDYHTKNLIKSGIILCCEDDAKIKWYSLAEIFYDSTLLGGLEVALYPLASVLAETPDVTDIVEAIGYMVAIFCAVYGANDAKEI